MFPEAPACYFGPAAEQAKGTFNMGSSSCSSTYRPVPPPPSAQENNRTRTKKLCDIIFSFLLNASKLLFFGAIEPCWQPKITRGIKKKNRWRKSQPTERKKKGTCFSHISYATARRRRWRLSSLSCGSQRAGYIAGNSFLVPAPNYWIPFSPRTYGGTYTSIWSAHSYAVLLRCARDKLSCVTLVSF